MRAEILAERAEMPVEIPERPRAQLCFHSRSRDAPPGRGVHEFADRPADFAELAAIPGWREVLSNFHAEEFVVDGRVWPSVEHYYQASKFFRGNPDFSELFTAHDPAHDPRAEAPVEIGPNVRPLAVAIRAEIWTSPVIAKAAGGRTGKLKNMLVRPKAVTMDPDFFDGRHNDEMLTALRAKFSQCDGPRTVLLATNDAILVHTSGRGAPAEVQHLLMQVRDEIRGDLRDEIRAEIRGELLAGEVDAGLDAHRREVA